MTPLPSARVTIPTTILLVIVLVFFFVKEKDTSKQLYLTEDPEARKELLAKDADNDNLKDWEEDLWGTDINNPDTDGDGTPDGEEIKSGRNPLLGGPDDSLNEETVETKTFSQVESDLTETDKFARKLFATYAGDVSGQNKEPQYGDLFKDLTETNTVFSGIKEITPTDFRVISGASKSQIRDYGNKLGASVIRHSPRGAEQELLIYQRAVENDSPEELEKLDPIIEGYKKIRNDLLSTTVPLSAISEHTRYANTVTLLIESISGMRQSMSDPVGSLPKTQLYPAAAEALALTVSNYKEFFRIKGIRFSEEEDGFYLFGDF